MVDLKKELPEVFNDFAESRQNAGHAACSMCSPWTPREKWAHLCDTDTSLASCLGYRGPLFARSYSRCGGMLFLLAHERASRDRAAQVRVAGDLEWVAE